MLISEDTTARAGLQAKKRANFETLKRKDKDGMGDVKLSMASIGAFFDQGGYAQCLVRCEFKREQEEWSDVQRETLTEKNDSEPSNR